MSTYFEDDAVTGQSFDMKILKFLWGFVSKYKSMFFISTLLGLLTSGLIIAVPRLVGLAIDQGIVSKSIEKIYFYGVILLVVRIFHTFVFGLQMYLMQIVGARIVHDLRVAIFSHVQKLSVSYFDKNPVGRVVTRLTNDVATIVELFAEGAVLMLFNIVFIVGAMTYIVTINWKLGLISMTAFPVLCYIAYRVFVALRYYKRYVRQKLASINASLSEHISGMRVVNLFAQEDQAIEKFDVSNDEYMNGMIKHAKIQAILGPSIAVSMSLSIALIILFGGKQVFDNALTVGVLVAFVGYVERIMHPVRDIMERYNVFMQTSTAVERLYKIQEIVTESDDSETETFNSPPGDVEFKNVSFKYNLDEEKNILDNISFKISRGERVAIVGSTGSGKTTILNLLNKFYTPQQGEILIDGRLISTLDRHNLRAHIGKIDQSVHIFSGTLRDNIVLGREISDAVLENALVVSNCRKIVEKYEGGLEYEITEGGKNLSFGERQLIVFARMAVYDPSILMMDEATSNIDSENETQITNAIAKMTEGRTSIIVAHRLSTITSSDRIYVIDSGKLVESGSHDELMKNCGHYSKLYEAMT